MQTQGIDRGSSGPADRTVAALLACGVVSSIVYVAGEVAASMSWQGYSYADQAVSELAAIEAPTRPLMLAVFTVYNLLVLAFAAGVWRAAGSRRACRAAAVALIVYAVVGEVTQVFSPMHVRGFGPMTATDAGHIVLTAVEVLSIMAMIVLGSGAGGRRFRVGSFVVLAIVVAGGVATGLVSQHMTAAASSTPWAGLLERVNIYGTMAWVLGLAVTLLRGVGGRRARPVATHVIASRGVAMMSVR